MISYSFAGLVKRVLTRLSKRRWYLVMNVSINELIAERLDAMPAGERRAAQTLIANYPLIGLKTVAEFSQAAGVSSPTILRFISRLGFQNYHSFQSSLQEELAAQIQSPASRTYNQPSPPDGALSPMLDATMENLRETFRHISQRQLTEIVGKIANPRGQLLLMGGRFTDPLARYMATHLTIIRPNVFHLSGQESTWRDRLIDISKRDVLLIFDIRRYQESLLHFAEKAHQRNADIILITDQWLSPIARFARHVIAGRTAVPSAWDSSASLFVVAETLISAVTAHLQTESEARIREIENLR